MAKRAGFWLETPFSHSIKYANELATPALFVHEECWVLKVLIMIFGINFDFDFVQIILMTYQTQSVEN